MLGVEVVGVFFTCCSGSSRSFLSADTAERAERSTAESLRVGAVSFGRLGLIKRLTVERHGVFKGDLSVPALTLRG